MRDQHSVRDQHSMISRHNPMDPDLRDEASDTAEPTRGRNEGFPTRAAALFKARLESFTYSTDGRGHDAASGAMLPTRSTLLRSSPGRTGSSRSSTRARLCAGAVISASEGKNMSSTGSLKRSATDQMNDDSNSFSPGKRRSTTKERSASDAYNPENRLLDSLRPGLVLVFIGLNPGLQTAATGHAYAHPSNLFWKLLHRSGITPKQHHPSETHALVDLYSIGNTNLCVRPTRSGDGLSRSEQEEGAVILEQKIASLKPEAVCIVGKGIWDVIWKQKTGRPLKPAQFHYGWQDEKYWLGRTLEEDGEIGWAGARTFVSTTTSGLAASMNPREKLEIWLPLGEWLKARRTELGLPSSIDDIRS